MLELLEIAYSVFLDFYQGFTVHVFNVVDVAGN